MNLLMHSDAIPSCFCSPSVQFCGYSMPHPSEPKINIRIQTRPGESANEALRVALDQLVEVCEHIETVYDAALTSFDAAGGNAGVVADAAGAALLSETASAASGTAAAPIKKKSKRKSEM
jgi:hypothetical protein